MATYTNMEPTNAGFSVNLTVLFVQSRSFSHDSGCSWLSSCCPRTKLEYLFAQIQYTADSAPFSLDCICFSALGKYCSSKKVLLTSRRNCSSPIDPCSILEARSSDCPP